MAASFDMAGNLMDCFPEMGRRGAEAALESLRWGVRRRPQSVAQSAKAWQRTAAALDSQHAAQLSKLEQEKKAAIIDAEGQSEAARLISDSIQKYGMGMIEVRRIDAAREIAHNLARSRNVTYLPSSNNMLLQVPP